ncbi:hypothetical protein GCM10022205_39830 [Spinactinospora alkalitolerans]
MSYLIIGARVGASGRRRGAGALRAATNAPRAGPVPGGGIRKWDGRTRVRSLIRSGRSGKGKR